MSLIKFIIRHILLIFNVLEIVPDYLGCVAALPWHINLWTVRKTRSKAVFVFSMLMLLYQILLTMDSNSFSI